MEDQYKKVAETNEFSTDGDKIIEEVDGVEIAVFYYDDEFYALSNYCVHQAGPLCEGNLRRDVKVGDDGWEWVYEDERKCITCPWHAWKFDITTGVCVDDDRYKTPTFEVEERSGGVYVKI